MTERESIIAYIEAKAARIRENAASGSVGGMDWTLARHGATVLDAVASDLRAGLNVEEDQAA